MKAWRTWMVAAVLIAGGLYIYLHWSSLPWEWLHSGPAPLPQSPIAAEQPAHMSWLTVSRPEDGFRIEMPAEPKDLQVPAINEAGGTEPVKMIVAAPDGDTTFAITWEDNPPVARVNQHAPDKTLDMARDGMLVRTQTSLSGESRLMVTGFPTRDITARNAQGGILDARLILAGDRLYALMALFPSSRARREQDVIRFFNSFASSRQAGESLPLAESRH